MADADERPLRSKERSGKTPEAAAKRQRGDVSEGRANTERRGSVCCQLKVQREEEVTVEKTNLTESIREKRNPHV